MHITQIEFYELYVYIPVHTKTKGQRQ